MQWFAHHRSSKSIDLTHSALLIVCQTDKSCSALLRSGDPFEDGLDGEEDGVCYKEGFAVKEMLQMCDVTSERIHSSLNRSPLLTLLILRS